MVTLKIKTRWKEGMKRQTQIWKNKKEYNDKAEFVRDQMQCHSHKMTMVLRQNSKTIPVSNIMQLNKKQGSEDWDFRLTDIILCIPTRQWAAWYICSTSANRVHKR